jgi:hypothetical protein
MSNETNNFKNFQKKKKIAVNFTKILKEKNLLRCLLLPSGGSLKDNIDLSLYSIPGI